MYTFVTNDEPDRNTLQLKKNKSSSIFKQMTLYQQQGYRSQETIPSFQETRVLGPTSTAFQVKQPGSQYKLQQHNSHQQFDIDGVSQRLTKESRQNSSLSINKSDLAIKRHKSSIVIQGRNKKRMQIPLNNEIDTNQFYNKSSTAKMKPQINPTTLSKNYASKDVECKELDLNEGVVYTKGGIGVRTIDKRQV